MRPAVVPGMLVLAALVAGAARAAAPPVPPAPADAADWDGLWEIEFGKSFMRPGQEQPVFTAEYAAKYKALQDRADAGHPMVGPETYCIPPGMPLAMAQPYPVEFLFSPGKITIVAEAFSQVRTIYMDGRGHPDDPDPTFNGHSIGHWEGDTLVVDTVQLRGDTYFQMTGKGQYYLAPHSDQLHIVERFRLTGKDTLSDSMVLTDAKALARPWHVEWSFTRHPDWTLREYVCQENNREAGAANGVANPVEGR